MENAERTGPWVWPPANAEPGKALRRLAARIAVADPGDEWADAVAGAALAAVREAGMPDVGRRGARPETGTNGYFRPPMPSVEDDGRLLCRACGCRSLYVARTLVESRPVTRIKDGVVRYGPADVEDVSPEWHLRCGGCRRRFDLPVGTTAAEADPDDDGWPE